ncbi:hypothetical protein MRX96_002144 [Rhipicephalus microplus]
MQAIEKATRKTYNASSVTKAAAKQDTSSSLVSSDKPEPTKMMALTSKSATTLPIALPIATTAKPQKDDNDSSPQSENGQSFKKPVESQAAGAKRTSPSIEDLERMLAEVLGQLSETGLRAQVGKCELLKESLKVLGHLIDAKGIYPSRGKVDAVHQAPAPKINKILQAFFRKEKFVYLFFD